jgi:acyl carrier protein
MFAACTTTEITARVRAFIVENFLFGDESRQFAGTDSFVQKGILDSTGILELIQFVESEFDVAVGDGETVPENLDSLAAVTAFIQRKRDGR